MKWRKVARGFYESDYGYLAKRSEWVGDWTMRTPYGTYQHGGRTLRDAKAAAEEHHRATQPEKGAEP